MRLLALALFAATLLPAADLKPVDEATFDARVLAPLKGKVVVVNLWATYCVPCRKEMPELVAMAARLKPRGLAFVTISADEAEQYKAASAFLDKVQVPAPTFVRATKAEEKFNQKLDPKWDGALPATIVYDKTGRKARAFFGKVTVAELEAAVGKLL